MVLVLVFGEILARATLFRIAEQAWGSRNALIASTVFFVLAHLPGDGINLLGIAVTAVLRWASPPPTWSSGGSGWPSACTSPGTSSSTGVFGADLRPRRQRLDPGFAGRPLVAERRELRCGGVGGRTARLRRGERGASEAGLPSRPVQFEPTLMLGAGPQ